MIKELKLITSRKKFRTIEPPKPAPVIQKIEEPIVIEEIKTDKVRKGKISFMNK